MFENLFRKNGTPADSDKEKRETAAGAEPDGALSGGDAQGVAGVSPGEIRVWRDRILAAGADDGALLQLAREAPAAELKVAALQALSQEESFKVAMDEYRERDKRLYRTAKSRLDAARAKRDAQAEAGVLIAGARSLLEQDLIPANRVAELDRAWAGISESGLVPEIQTEFAALRGQLGARMRARGESEQALTVWLKTVDEAIDRLTASLPSVAQGNAALDEAQSLAASLLELLSGDQDRGDARRSAKTDAANRALALAASVVERAKFLQSLPAPGSADEAGEKLAIEEWRGFPEVSEGDLHTVLATRFADWRNASAQERQLARDTHRAQERQQTAEQTQRHASVVEREVEAAETAQADGHVADLARLLGTIDQALKRGPVSTALRQRIEALRREHLRLRHWQRWGGGQRREELAAEAQELARAAAGKISVQEHAAAITKLRERWKELDKLGGASKQAVWLTFDGALKAAYAPVAAHLDKLRRAREENLAARNRIVDGLIQAAAKLLPREQAAPEGNGATASPTASGGNPDWRAIARTLEEAQVAWRKLGPVEHTVPRKALQGEKAVTSRYAAAVQSLEAPLQSVYAEARRQREQLIAGAKELAESDVAARDVVDKVRRLQAQWQAIAKAMPLPRREEESLWTAFRTPTDAIFAARDAGRAAKEAEFVSRINIREQIIERLTAQLSARSVADIKRAMAEADGAWRASPEIPRPQASRLDGRYRAAREAATKRMGEIASRASQARFDALIGMLELCRERETAQDSGRELTQEESSDLEARWNAVEDIPAGWKSRLDARFRGVDPSHATATPIAQSSSSADKKSGKKMGEPGGETLADILLNLEVACSIDSPAEFLAARQQLKIRALKTAMEGRQATVTTPADIERWLLDAASTPRPDEVSRQRMGRIIAAVRARRA